MMQMKFVLATGSLPDELGYQRWLPEHVELPGPK